MSGNNFAAETVTVVYTEEETEKRKNGVPKGI